MNLNKFFTSGVLCILSSISLVLAGPGGYIELANLTPYDWVLNYTHSYHMDWKFPRTIPSGSAKEQYFESSNWGFFRDSGAEAAYELVGSPEPASFTIQARQKKEMNIQIQFGDTLSSIGNPIGSLIQLGFTQDGTVFFTLAGNESETGHYVSSNGPVAWMQATLPTIAKKSLREIAMPASHDAGLSQITRTYTGSPHNTVTQSVHVYQQLVYGARWFDIRPVVRKGKWYTNHGEVTNFGFIGAFGRTISNIIKDINRFTAEFPGELIILDVSHELSRGTWKQSLLPKEWQAFYNLLYDDLNDLWMADMKGLPEDLSAVPIQTFVQPGSRSAVLIRLPDYAPAFTATVRKRDLDDLNDLDVRTGSENTTATDEPLSLDAPSTVPSNSTLNDDDDNAPDNPDTIDDTTSDITDISNLNSNSTFNSTMLPKLPPLPSHKSPPPTTLIPAFISSHRLPTTGTYSNTQSPSFLSTDQLTKLSTYRISPTSTIHQSTWTLTQRILAALKILSPSKSILALAVPAHRALFRDIWRGLSSRTYPNLIEVDDFGDGGVRDLCLAINGYFALGRDLKGGDGGGKALGKRRMMPMNRGRPAVSPRVEIEWNGRRMEWFVNAIWCSLKIGSKPCWAEKFVEEKGNGPMARVREVAPTERTP